jgi:NaMN:DMB phosphoribosyltransferase
MCLIQFCVTTPHFYSFFSKQLQELPLVALSSQEKITIKIPGFSLHPGANIKTQHLKPNI